MPRIRTIKPSFFKSEDVSALPLRARLTWIGLWTQCDDAGRAKDNVRLIKAELWPLDNVSLRDVEDDLDTLEEHGRIVRYEVNGKPYLEVANWGEHQNINRPSTSTFPPPPAGFTEDSVRTHGTLTDDSPGEGKGKEGKGKERRKERRRSHTIPDPPRDDVEQLCGQLLTRLHSNGVKATITNEWRKQARLLLDRDQRPLEQALRLIDWTTSHHFWSANVHGMPKFRTQYDRLRMQQEQGQNGQVRPSTRDQRITQTQALKTRPPDADQQLRNGQRLEHAPVQALESGDYEPDP